MEVIQQPAALTLWTFYQYADVQRVEALTRRTERFDQSGLIYLATWDGKGFMTQQKTFERQLKRHPDPEVRKAMLARDRAASEALIESIYAGGKGPRKETP